MARAVPIPGRVGCAGQQQVAMSLRLGGHRVDPCGQEEQAGQDQGLILLTARTALGVPSAGTSLQAYAVPALPRGARLAPQHPRNVGDRSVILHPDNRDLFTAR